MLFTASFFWRRYVVEAQADALAIREQTPRRRELSGSVVRLSLTGSRGLATCFLWMQRHRQAEEEPVERAGIHRPLADQAAAALHHALAVPELEPRLQRLRRVRPRSTTNISTSRAASHLLAEGERQNRDNPDLRFYVGFYTQHKISQSDETNVMRSLFQLS